MLRIPLQRRTVATVACTLATMLLSASVPAAAPPARPATSAAASPALVEVGQSLPNLKMSGLNGPSRTLASYRGRPLVINVWASWCTPCRQEAASLERLAWSEAGGKFDVIGVSTDDHRANAMKWLQQSNATVSHFLDSPPDWPLENVLGANSIPVTVLVDAQGRVVGRFRGARDWSTPESIKLIETTFSGARKVAQR